MRKYRKICSVIISKPMYNSIRLLKITMWREIQLLPAKF